MSALRTALAKIFCSAAFWLQLKKVIFSQLGEYLLSASKKQKKRPVSVFQLEDLNHQGYKIHPVAIPPCFSHAFCDMS